MAKKIKKTVIFVGYECNNNCIFCINWDKRNIQSRTTSEIKKEMIGAKNRGSTYLEMIGGETTIRPDIVELISFAKDLGFRTIMMATNGRMYSYKKVAREIIEAGLNSIVFSIHGHNANLHDSLTQAKGSFEQLKKGIENVKEMGLKNIGSNTTIIKQNYKKLGIRNSEFIFVDPTYGAAFNFFDKLVPKISQVAPFVHRCLDIGKKNNVAHWHVRYVPLCYFTNYLDQVSELQEVKTFKTEHIAPDFYNPHAEEARKNIGRAKTKRCEGCSLYNECEGIWKEYLKHYGDKELNKITK